MITNADRFERLGELLSIALDEELSGLEQKELNEILRSGSEALQYFHRYIDLHTELQWMLNPDVLEMPIGLETLATKSTALPTRSQIISLSGWLGLAAALAVILTMSLPKAYPPVEEFVQAVSRKSFVARANYSRDANLGEKSTVVREGEWVSLGKIVLEKGTLGLTFDSGALLVLNAPAEFDVETANRGFLHSGQAVARVPEPAIGFIINTPNSTLVDLGTEFSINVESNKSSVKVIDGEIRAYAETENGETEELLLKQDQAVHIDDQASAAFSPADDFSPEAFHDWSRFLKPVADYVHFSFDEGGKEIVTSDAWGEGTEVGFNNAMPTAAFMPVSRVGVYGEALRFTGKGDYMETDLEGIPGSRPRTVACWIKVPPKQHGTAIAIVSWGQPRKGERWQIGINHNVAFGVLGAVRTDFSHGFVTGATDLRDGRWHHIASVYIGGNSPDIAAHVRHYVDGKLEAVSGFRQAPVPIDTQVDEQTRADNLIIGYRNIVKQGKINTFRGSIDELYIFDAAILPSQIENLKDQNHPDDTRTQVAIQ